MRKLLPFAFVIFLQSCNPVYMITNTTDAERKVAIGMKVQKESQAVSYEKYIEHGKGINIIDKKNSRNDSAYFTDYLIAIPPHKRIKLSDFIFTIVLRKELRGDSIDIRLHSGQPIFVKSESIKINKFRFLLYPWYQRLYFYKIEEH